MTTNTLDRDNEHTLYVVTAVEAKTGVRRELWFGSSLRNAVRQQNVRMPQKFGTIYHSYVLEERKGA